MKESKENLIQDGKARYDSSLKWSSGILFATFLFYLTTFSQYLAIQNALGESEHNLKELKQSMALVSFLADESKALKQKSFSLYKKEQGQLHQRILKDIQAIEEELKLAGSANTPNIEPSIHETEALAIQTTASQMPPLGSVEASPRLEPELKKRLIEMSSRESRRILLPWCHEKIILPRFKQANLRLKEGLTQIQENFKRKIQQQHLKSSLKKQMPEAYAEVLQSFQGALNGLLALRIEEPKNNHWWRSSTGKGAHFTNMKDTVSAMLSRDLKGKPLDSLLDKLEVEIKKQSNTLNSTLRERTDLTEKFESQEEEAASLGFIFKFVSLKLDHVVYRFPLILSCILVIVTVWPTLRRRDLVRTLSLVKKPKAFREWLDLYDLGNSPRLNRLWSSYDFLAFFWVGLTCYQLAAAKIPDSSLITGIESLKQVSSFKIQALVLFGLSSPLLWFARVYRKRISMEIAIVKGQSRKNENL